MNNTLQVIEQREVLGHELRVYGTAQEPLFLAKDVAEWIEYTKTSQGYYNVSKMLQVVDEDEKLLSHLVIGGQTREVWMLTEDGLYEVLMNSNKPIAKEFKKKVKEILKQIRMTGGYIPVYQEETPEQFMARAFIMAQKTLEQKELLIQQQQSKIELDAPKVEYHDNVLQSEGTYTTTEIAKETYLGTAQKLHKVLAELKIMFKQGGKWHLYSQYSGKGYTKNKTHVYETDNGYKGTNSNTVWTEKGRAFIHETLKKYNPDAYNEYNSK